MVFDPLAAVEAGYTSFQNDLAEATVVCVPEDLGEVAAGPVFRSGGIGAADSLEGRAEGWASENQEGICAGGDYVSWGLRVASSRPVGLGDGRMRTGSLCESGHPQALRA